MHTDSRTLDQEPPSVVPLRRDARENRAAIICAAGRLLADRGAHVALEDVAKTAGVGIATLYRRFPTRDALVEAVIEERMLHYAATTEELARRATREPWAAFRDYVLLLLEQQAADRAFAEVVTAPLADSAICLEQRRRVFRSSLAIVKRAKDAGVVRPDFEHSDFYLLTLAGDGLFRTAGADAAEAWRRLGAYLLEAFRTVDTAALPPAPAAWRHPARVTARRTDRDAAGTRSS